MKSKKIPLMAGLVLILSLTLSACGSEENPEETSNSEMELIDANEVEDDSEFVEDNSEEEEELEDDYTAEENIESDVSTGSLEGFSTSDQEVGTADSSDDFTLKSIKDVSMSGYHRFTFAIEDQDSGGAIADVTAEYDSGRGAIIVKITQIRKNEADIVVQKSRVINKNGITNLYRAISTDTTKHIYEIGVSKSTSFKLHVADEAASPVQVYLDVQYPGTSSSALDLDSNVFSSEKQALTGAVAADGAGVTRFTYNAASGVVTIHFEVAGTSDKPVPDCYAEYVDGKLNLVFTSLKSAQTKNTYSWDVANVGKVTHVRDGEKSTYIFEGISGKDFRLSGSTSPNHVILEIKK